MSDVPVSLSRRPTLTESAVGTPPPTPQTPASDTATITVNGRQVQVRPGQWIIEAVEAAGVYVPRFCYHPRMKPVGMCRVCLVEVEGPRGGSLMPACYNAVVDGMVIRTDSPVAKKAQEGVLEFLLVNHPLDCPVCDKGGECPLQDQTLAYGPGESRFVEEKRHWEKPIPISELVLLDRERCIQCGRCVRFADEVAGDALIDFADRTDRTEVATFPDAPYSSYFSGNVVQICPVGALTARTYRFKARPWDLEQVETTCTICAVGCRGALQATAGELSRLIGVDSDPVNWGWLCDKGRFSVGAFSAPSRVVAPLIRKAGELVEVGWAEALDFAAAGLSAARASGGGRYLGVIGGARLPNEDAYVWAKLARTVLGTDNVDAQLGDGLPAETVLGLRRATIDEMAGAALVITLGPDIKDELPVLYLRLRHAIRENGTQLVELTPAPTGLSRYAAVTAQYRPGEAASLAAAVTSRSEVTGEVAGVSRDVIQAVRAHVDAATRDKPPGTAQIVVILGRTSLTESEEQLSAAASILAGLPGVAFLPALRRGNVNGAIDLGLAPGVLPGAVSLEAGRAWFEHHWDAELPEVRGLSTGGMLEAASRGRIGGLVLVGSDPVVDFPDARLALRGILGARFVVAVDTHMTESSRRAHVLLPAAAWAERRGTFTNIERRISWLGQLVTDRGVAWPDWMIASELARRLGRDLGYSGLEDIWAEMTAVSPLHAGLTYDLISGTRARDGVVVPHAGEPARGPRPLDPMADPGIASAELHKVAPTAILVTGVAASPETETGSLSDPGGAARQGAGGADATGGAPEDVAATEPRRPAGRERAGLEPADQEDQPPPPPPPPPMIGPPQVPQPAATTEGAAEDLRLVSRRSMWDGGTSVQSVPVLAGLHPAPAVRVNPAVLADLGVADGVTVCVRSSTGCLSVPALGDPALLAGTAVLPFNLPGTCAAELIDARSAFTQVRIEVEGGQGGAGVG